MYLWLERQKVAGRFEPTAWFLVMLAVGVAAAVYGAQTPFPRRRVGLVLGGCLLIALSALSVFALGTPTSRPGALFVSIGVPLVAAGGLCLVAARQHEPVTVRRRWFVCALALLVTGVAVTAASDEAGRGEGEGGTASPLSLCVLLCNAA